MGVSARQHHFSVCQNDFRRPVPVIHSLMIAAGCRNPEIGCLAVRQTRSFFTLSLSRKGRQRGLQYFMCPSRVTRRASLGCVSSLKGLLEVREDPGIPSSRVIPCLRYRGLSMGTGCSSVSLYVRTEGQRKARGSGHSDSSPSPWLLLIWSWMLRDT